MVPQCSHHARQWIVEGGKFKASFLLPDTEGGNESAKGLLISETVVPGFDYRDHDFNGATLPLPGKITAEYQDVRLILVIRSWQLGAAQ